MKAAFLDKANDISLRDIPIPKYSQDEVLINIKAIGICGSDLHFYKNGKMGSSIIKEPLILGHECSGVIEAIGKNVENLEVGDRVAIEPCIPCYKCNYCKAGKYHLCDKLVFMGAAPTSHGAFTEYIKYDPNFVFKISSEVSFEDAAAVEPLSVGFNSAIKVGIRPGSNVCIIGFGPIGFACLEMSKIMGASKIFVSDISDFRLNIAKEHGAYCIINARRENLIEKIRDLTNGEGIECVIETAGHERTLIQSLEIVKKDGKIGWLSVVDKDMITIPYFGIILNDITIEGIHLYTNTYKPIIDLLESKRINLSNWVTNRFKIDDIVEAFKVASDSNIDKMKIIINT